MAVREIRLTLSRMATSSAVELSDKFVSSLSNDEKWIDPGLFYIYM